MEKGISPLIASVILVAIAVSAAAIAGPEVMRFVRKIAEDTGDRTSEEIECSRAGIYVREAAYNTTTDELKFQVENTGYQDLKDFRADVFFVNGTSSTYFFYGSGETLPGKSSRWFTANRTVDSGAFESIVIISETCPGTGRATVSNSSIDFRG